MRQGELFDGLKSNTTKVGLTSGGGKVAVSQRVELKLTLDKVVFIIIAVLILLIVIFSVGVEHGKKLQKESQKNERSVESYANLTKIRELRSNLDKGRTAVKKVEEPKVEAKSLQEKTSEAAAHDVQSSPKGMKELFEKRIREKAVSPESGKYYEVRLLSTKNEDYSEKEVGKLIKKDFPASYRKSGDYYLIVLGPFAERTEADEALDRARKSSLYKDAYIRKMRR